MMSTGTDTKDFSVIAVLRDTMGEKDTIIERIADKVPAKNKLREMSWSKKQYVVSAANATIAANPYETLVVCSEWT